MKRGTAIAIYNNIICNADASEVRKEDSAGIVSDVFVYTRYGYDIELSKVQFPNGIIRYFVYVYGVAEDNKPLMYSGSSNHQDELIDGLFTNMLDRYYDEWDVKEILLWMLE